MTIEEAIAEKLRKLPPEKQQEVLDFADFLQGRAEIDADPLSAEDWAEVKEGESAIRRGDFTTLEDLKSELGL